METEKEGCGLLRLVVLLGVLGLFLALMAARLHPGYKLGLNALCGFGCLIVLNLLSDVTGILFALNFFTCAVVAVLGLPGIGALLIVHSLVV